MDERRDAEGSTGLVMFYQAVEKVFVPLLRVNASFIPRSSQPSSGRRLIYYQQIKIWFENKYSSYRTVAYSIKLDRIETLNISIIINIYGVLRASYVIVSQETSGVSPGNR